MTQPIPVVKVGDKIYIQTSISIDHGWDDITGGLGTVKSIKPITSGGQLTLFVEIEEIPGRRFNWDQYLAQEQDKLRAEFGERVAGPDPDFPDHWSDNQRLVWLTETYGSEIAHKVGRK